MKYGTDIIFEGNKLFSGAIDIDWLYSNKKRAYEAALAHVFHGPKYHYISNEEQRQISSKFTDSITMTKKLLEVLTSPNNEKRVVLSIAGFGAGKSHLALTLSLLFSRDPNVFQSILNEIKNKDSDLFNSIVLLLNEDPRPYLVIPVNGMNNANLKDLMFSNISNILDYNGDSKACLNKFDQRYAYLKNTVKTHVMQNQIIHSLKKCGFESIEEFCNKMDQYDEEALNSAYDMLNKDNIELFMPASKGELRDLITTVASSLCGKGKKYKGLIIVFDEFGKYMSFAAASEAIAGQGALQQLFEGVQGVPNDIPVLLWGLSQLDLQQYQQTTANANFANNMNRYVTRYSIADKYYLSVCFESLLANLISKPKNFNKLSESQVAEYRKNLNQIFNMTLQYPLWTDNATFMDAICNGGWPLSPASVWTLTYITSVNNMLQQRSGFAILNSTFSELEGTEVPQGNFSIYPVDLFKGGLGTEFIASENSKTSPDTIATEYESVLSKYGQKLSEVNLRVLQAIVLSYKLKANCKTETQAKLTISMLANVKSGDVSKSLDFLVNDLNCVYFNQGLKLFEIKSDSATSLEFRRFIDNKIIEFYRVNSEDRIYNLVGKMLRENLELEAIRNEVFEEIESDFAFKNDIASVEWVYESIIAVGANYLSQTKLLIDSIRKNPPTAYNEPKGKLLYYLLPSTVGLKQAMGELSSIIKSDDNLIPVMGLVLHDKDNIVKDLLIELSVIEKLSTSEIEKFDNIIVKRKRDIKSSLFYKLLDMKSDSNRIYPFSSKKPRFIAGTKIFESLYPNHISFDIDGIRKENSTGLKTVNDFCIKLATPDISWNDFLALQSKDVNRAKSLLERGWQIFDNNGAVLRYPKYSKLKLLFSSIDNQVQEKNIISVYSIFQFLTAAPIGCNSTQATIILFIYFAGRNKEIEFERDGKIVTLSSLLGNKSCFDSKTYALSKTIWENIYFKLKITDDVVWYNLLQEWKNCKDLNANDEFNTRATELSKKVKVPSQYIEVLGNLRERFINCKEKYLNWNEENVIFKTKFEKYISGNAIDLLASDLVLYIKKYREIFDKVVLKDSFTIEEFKSSYRENLQVLCKQYKKWIEVNDLSEFFDRKESFDRLKDKYLLLIKSFTEFGKKDIAEELTELVTARMTDCSKYRKSNQLLTSLRERCISLNTDIEKGGINYSLAIKYKNEIQNLSKQFEDISSEIVIGSTEYASLVTAVDNCLNNLDVVIEDNLKKVESLRNMHIHDLEDVEKVEELINSLFAFYPTDYALCNSIISILKNARGELSELKKAYWGLLRECQDYQSAEIFVNNKKNEFLKLFGTDPIFRYSDFLDNCLSRVKKIFISKSNEWVNNQEKNLTKCITLEDYLRISHNLEYLPTYLTKEDFIRAKQCKDNIDDKISKKKVEYIIKLCRDLDREELARVVAAINKLK